MPKEGPENVWKSLQLVAPALRRAPVELERTYDNTLVSLPGAHDALR